jgi:hypothetical protein
LSGVLVGSQERKRGRATAKRTRRRTLRRDLVVSRRSGRSYDELDALALADLEDDFLWVLCLTVFFVVLEADADADEEEEVSEP